jgi:hypothetical protein
MKEFDQGDRVMTPCGVGSVVYRRMFGSEIQAYSVCLDSRKEAMEKPPFPSYTGTIFRPCDLKEET